MFRTGIDNSPSPLSMVSNLMDASKYFNVSRPGCLAYPVRAHVPPHHSTALSWEFFSTHCRSSSAMYTYTSCLRACWTVHLQWLRTIQLAACYSYLCPLNLVTFILGSGFGDGVTCGRRTCWSLAHLWWGHMRQGQILSIQRGAIPCATRQMERTATLVHG